MKRTALALTFILALLVSTMVGVTTVHFGVVQASTNVSNLSPITINADKYLVSVYNSTLDLIPETSTNNVYWITSDNLLAYFALQNYNSDISNSIKTTIMAYASTYGLPRDSNGLPIDYKHEAVIGDDLTQQFGVNNDYSLVNDSGYTIKAEVDNGSVMSDWQNYADLVAYKGLSDYNQGDIQDATTEYNLMMQMWNGHGFNDTAYNETTGLYDTYKLALALLLAKDCQIPQNEEMYNIISSMQDSNGGIHTQYTFENNLTIVGSVNTETTALVAIANPTPTPTAEFPSSVILSLVIILAISVSVVLMLRKRKIDKS